MLVRECMTKNVKIIDPDTTLKQAAQVMKEGDFGALPIRENNRLVGMITDRDIVVRGVAEGLDPNVTKVFEVASKGVLYCYDDQDAEEVAENMGDTQVRRLPVLNREKRLVGIIALGDLALSDGANAGDALMGISEHGHREATKREHAREGQQSLLT